MCSRWFEIVLKVSINLALMLQNVRDGSRLFDNVHLI